MDWAQKRYTQKRVEEIKERTISKSDQQWGEYMPFTVLWSDTQGKDEAGLIAATNYAFACLKYYLEGKELSPGRPWIRYHSMTKRNEFLFVRSGFRDGIDEKDTLRTTRYEDTNNKTLTDGLNGIVETLKRPAEPGAGQQPDTKKRKEKTAAQKKEEEEIRNMHKVLTTLKKSMESVMMQSYNLVQKITTGGRRSGRTSTTRTT